MAMAHSAIFRIGAVAAGDIAAAEQDFRGWDTAHYSGGRAAFGALIAAGASVAAAKALVATVSRVSRAVSRVSRPSALELIITAIQAVVTCEAGG